jgi:hypothetical protein
VPSLISGAFHIKPLEESGVLECLPAGIGAGGDLAYMDIASLHPQGFGVTPRRKPPEKVRPSDDIAFNRAFARRRIVVEHTSGRMRRYEALLQTDRDQRNYPSFRARAVAGLVNRQPRHLGVC